MPEKINFVVDDRQDQQKKIFIVDDRQDQLLVVETILSNFNCDIRTFESADEAEVAFDEFVVVVVADLLLGRGYNGDEFIRWIIAQCNSNDWDLPLLLLVSASSMNPDQFEDILPKVIPMEKPLNAEEVIDKVKQHLGTP